jgi:hypothetical protein
MRKNCHTEKKDFAATQQSRGKVTENFCGKFAKTFLCMKKTFAATLLRCGKIAAKCRDKRQIPL